MKIENKLLIILGSKNDKLTSRLLQNYEKLNIKYILVDFDNLQLTYYPEKKKININKNFSSNDLLIYIKKINKNINPKRDCIFLIGFGTDFNKHISEYKIACFIRKRKFHRFFYNRRSSRMINFITNNFYGEMTKNKYVYPNQNLILSKLKTVKKYRTEARISVEKDHVIKKIAIKKIIKELILFIFYFIKYVKNFLQLYFKIDKKKNLKKIVFVMPKNQNWFLTKSGSHFKNYNSILDLITKLSLFHKIVICPHPLNRYFHLKYLCKFWNIKIIKNIYSDDSQKIIKNSDLTITIGSSAVIDLLLSQTVVLEIGKTPRVCNLYKGYFFMSEKNFSFIKLNSLLIEIINKKKKIDVRLPKFSAVFYPKIKLLKYDLSPKIVNNTEIKFLVEFIIKQLKKNKY